MDILFFIIATVVATIVFKIIFVNLNKSIPSLFAPIQKFTNRPDRKNIYKNVSFILIILGNVYIKKSLNLNYIEFGITLGILLSLHDIIFDNNLNFRI